MILFNELWSLVFLFLVAAYGTMVMLVLLVKNRLTFFKFMEIVWYQLSSAGGYVGTSMIYGVLLLNASFTPRLATIMLGNTSEAAYLQHRAMAGAMFTGWITGQMLMAVSIGFSVWFMFRMYRMVMP